ncbi:hypothetical protein ACRYCC_26355 [Actinomadura scrupuli]|uniref:hypothetical protein n=1 Tax=Actinomadura scrupuli TaxID=559629 RepID=UPI003D96F42A
MSLIEHARRELELCGQAVEDPEYAEAIVNAVAAFASYGHSGGSAMVAREQLHSLLGFEPLSPLTSDPAEWIDRSDISGTPMWQSARDPKAFSTDGGKTWYLLGEEAPSGGVEVQQKPAKAHAIQWTGKNIEDMEELLGELFDYDPESTSDPDEAGVMDCRRGQSWQAIYPTDWAVLLGPGRATVMNAETYAEIYEAPVTLYGIWRVHEEPAKTGWLSTGGGHVIVAEDPLELTRLAGTEIREFPGTFPHSEWAQGELPPALEIVPAVRTGPEHYREGVRLLTNAAARDAEGARYGQKRRNDPGTALLTGRARAHFAAAQVAATAAAVHPGSVSWQEAIGT